MMDIEKISPRFKDLALQGMGRRPTTVRDLQGILTLIDRVPGNVLEIGTWYGSTLYELATRFPEKQFYSVDFLEIQLQYEIAMTTRASREDIGKFAKHLPNVHLLYQKSETIDYSSMDNISLVFVDGDHGYDGVKKDTELALKHLKGRKGSIICWHDYGVPIFGVTKYIDTEIAPKYHVKRFESSKVAYITL